MQVYGPYKRKDNRRIVIIVYDDGTRTTKSYARFFYEVIFGKVPDNLDVDHIDEDKLNDSLKNFQLLTRSENAAKSMKKKPAEWYLGKCSECNTDFLKRTKDVRGNQAKGKAGPFCSRKCAGIYSTRAYANRKSERT